MLVSQTSRSAAAAYAMEVKKKYLEPYASIVQSKKVSLKEGPQKQHEYERQKVTAQRTTLESLKRSRCVAKVICIVEIPTTGTV